MYVHRQPVVRILFQFFVFLFQLTLDDITRHADVYRESSDGGALNHLKVTC